MAKEMGPGGGGRERAWFHLHMCTLPCSLGPGKAAGGGQVSVSPSPAPTVCGGVLFPAQSSWSHSMPLLPTKILNLALCGAVFSDTCYSCHGHGRW